MGKKILACLLVAMVSLMLAVPTATASAIFFDGFEGDLTGWTGTGNAAYGLTQAEKADTNVHVYNGDKVLVIGDRTATYSDITPDVLVKRQLTGLQPGEKYTVSAMAYGATSSGKARITVDEDGQHWTTDDIYGDSTTIAAGEKWVSVFADFTAPESGAVWLTVGYAIGLSGLVYYDNVRLEYTDSVNFLANGDFEAIESKTEDSVTFDWAASWNYTTAAAVMATSVGTGAGNSTHRISIANEGLDGSKALKMQVPQNSYNYRTYQRVQGLTAGATYKLSAWVKTVGTMTSFGVLTWAGAAPSKSASDFYNGSGTTRKEANGGTHPDNYVNSYAKTDGAWEKLTTFFTLPADKTDVYIVLALHTGYAATDYPPLGNTTYGLVDEVRLEKASNATVEFFGSDGNALTNLNATGDTAVTVKFIGANWNVDAAVPCKCLIATYSDNNGVSSLMDAKLLLVSGVSAAKNLLYSATDSFLVPSMATETLDITVPDGEYVKVFVWNSMGEINPLTRKTTLCK